MSAEYYAQYSQLGNQQQNNNSDLGNYNGSVQKLLLGGAVLAIVGAFVSAIAFVFLIDRYEDTIKSLPLQSSIGEPYTGYILFILLALVSSVYAIYRGFKKLSLKEWYTFMILFAMLFCGFSMFHSGSIIFNDNICLNSNFNVPKFCNTYSAFFGGTLLYTAGVVITVVAKIKSY